MSKLKSFFIGRRHFALEFAYAGTVVAFLWICSHFYLPGKAFTYLVEFGAREEPRYIPELRAIDHYDLPDSFGYDGQYYAQIAMRPRLGDPVLSQAVDNLPYRARRILFCWTAWVLAGGNPARALFIFSVQNIVAWMLLAGLLLRWFPPVNWGNWARWAGVLASYGLCVSLRSSLMDGPSLLLIASGVALLECRRPWLAAAVFGISGLAKETNLMAAAALGPEDKKSWRAWLRTFGRWALVAFPLAVWIAVLSWRLHGGGGAGARNFARPFAGYLKKSAEMWSLAAHGPTRLATGSLLIHVALTAQWLFFVLRPRWSDPWWRIGAAYAALMVVLGDAVWEGYPGAVSRVALPMLLAFNVLVPRQRLRWCLLLLAGNLSVFASPLFLDPPVQDSFRCEIPWSMRLVAGPSPAVDAIFDAAWYPPESSWMEYWRWTGGAATVVFRNPHPYALSADITFGLRAEKQRSVSVKDADRVIWQGSLDRGVLRPVAVRNVTLEPGDTTWHFTTDRPPLSPSAEEPRLLAFSLRNLKVDILGK